MGMKTYISVILPLKLEWEPCYALPESQDPGKVRTVEQEPVVRVGDRVKVEFARKAYTGVVSAVGIEPETELHKIKEIVTVENGLERIREEEIALWRRVAGYYMCSVGEVYKAAYPQRKINLEEARAAALHKAQQRHERMLEAMRDKVTRLQGKLEEKTKAFENARPGTKKREQLESMVERLTYEVGIAESALARAEAEAQSVQSENKAGQPDSQNPIPSQPEPDITLTSAQNEAYLQTCDSLKTGKPVMLHGVTGAGKTEIYIKLAADTLRNGRNVLYLVPEIALSKQLTDRLDKHFGERLLTYHSGESEARRRTIAEKIRTTDKAGYIVLGTRSSLFLPHNNLGLIIVDEEHDTSYKQDSPAPRYNGRDTALMLSVIHKCGIILGSATPSLEELYNCECGRHTLVTLSERYHGDTETEIEIIDT